MLTDVAVLVRKRVIWPIKHPVSDHRNIILTLTVMSNAASDLDWTKRRCRNVRM